MPPTVLAYLNTMATEACATRSASFPLPGTYFYLGGNDVEEQAATFGGVRQCRVISRDQVVHVVERILGLGVLEEFLLHL